MAKKPTASSDPWSGIAGGCSPWALRAGLEEMGRRGIKGKDVTPFLLDRFAAETGGESLRVNKKIISGNARVAARVAVALAGME